MLLKNPEKGMDGMSEEAPPSSSRPSSKAAYATELADLLKVPEDDRDAFREALEGYVRACAADEESAEEEE